MQIFILNNVSFETVIHTVMSVKHTVMSVTLLCWNSVSSALCKRQGFKLPKCCSSDCHSCLAFTELHRSHNCT